MTSKDRLRAQVERLSDLDRAIDVLRERDPNQGELNFSEGGWTPGEETAWTTELPPPIPEVVDDEPEGSDAEVPEIAPVPAETTPPEVAENVHDTEITEFDPRFETNDDPRIPEGQSYFKIGEVSHIVGVKPYVLRYWEQEFTWVRPEKTSSRQRRYRRQDVAILLTIRRLRHDEQLTIARTRELIQDMKRSGKKRPAKPKRSGRLGASASVDSTIDPALLRRRLAEMRQAVLDLLEVVDD